MCSSATASHLVMTGFGRAAQIAFFAEPLLAAARCATGVVLGRFKESLETQDAEDAVMLWG